MVVLPAPLGPRSADALAGADDEVDAVDGAHLGEGLHEPPGLQHGSHGEESLVVTRWRRPWVSEVGGSRAIVTTFRRGAKRGVDTDRITGTGDSTAPLQADAAADSARPLGRPLHFCHPAPFPEPRGTHPMSVDSTALERSALERKDRDELLTIAQALGGKPPSRAKKADIVELILQLTGVSADGGGPAAASDAEAPEPAARTRLAPCQEGSGR